MPATPATDAAISRLCLGCGMCCNGVMFHLVRLQPADSPQALAALGMKLRHKKGRHHFTQPCAFLKRSCCTIYADRPERCRLFECRQIQRLKEGRQDEARTALNIQDMQERVQRMEALLEQSENTKVKQPLSERYARVMAEPCHPDWDAEAVRLREELQQEMSVLNRILNEDFRLVPIHLPAP